jgi:hypothetical protein
MSEQRSTLRLLEQIEAIEASCGVPVLTGNTGDVLVGRDETVVSLPHLLAREAARNSVSTVMFSLARGSWELNPGSAMPSVGLRNVSLAQGAAPALTDLVSQLATLDLPVRLVVDYSDLLFPDSTASDPILRDQERLVETLSELALARSSHQSPHRLLVLSRAGGALDRRLLQMPGFQEVTVGLPNLPERLTLLNRLQNPAVGGRLRLEEGLTVEVASRLTGGLAGFDLLQAREASTTTQTPLTRSWIQARKTASIRRAAADSLIVYPPGNGLKDVAGLPQVRLLINECRQTNRPPGRILLAGPPGVGKTLVVRAIADELGYPAVALGNYRNMYVGETERRFRLALQVVRDLAPCVLHIDEIDQSVGQRTQGQSSDGGTSERVLADMWTFLGGEDSRQVTVVATSNRPDLLDAAMFDRFEIIPVLHPQPAEVAEIIRIAAKQQGVEIEARVAESAAREYPYLLTGRVVVAVVQRALTIADVAGVHVGYTHLKDAFDELMTAVDEEDHKFQALRAVALTTFESRLPWEAARRLGQHQDVPDYIRQFLDVQTGRIDRAKLAKAGHGS